MAIEKVNPAHPDKIADRIAGAIVDLVYNKSKKPNPKVAVEVLLGHSMCSIIVETDPDLVENKQIFADGVIRPVLERIVGKTDYEKAVDHLSIIMASQDGHLAQNQFGQIKCGDNGIFKGEPLTEEEKELSKIAHDLYQKYPTDGKYILDKETNTLIICQSNLPEEDIEGLKKEYCEYNVVINPIGPWTGGLSVDSGATNRKLGSDMGHSITGGGLHGKDFSKADLSINIYAFLKAQETGKPVNLFCAIGETTIDGKPYSEIVRVAKDYIKEVGGFEKFAEWGLV